MASDRPATIRLARVGEALESLPRTLDWLTPEERTRHDGMRSPRRREQFLVGHWLLRIVGAGFGGSSPDDWSFLVDEHGRPGLRSRHPDRCILQASVSHSGDWVAVAAAMRPIGIDIECDSRPRDLDRLAAEIFPEAQWRPLRELSDAARRSAFYEQWTLREAMGKRGGRGLVPGVTRSQYFETSAPADADALTWIFGETSFALAVDRPDEAIVIGLPGDVAARGWRLAVP